MHTVVSFWLVFGDKITKGQEIAKSGATGDVTGAHLHFEIRVNDNCIDPRTIIEF